MEALRSSAVDEHREGLGLLDTSAEPPALRRPKRFRAVVSAAAVFAAGVMLLVWNARMASPLAAIDRGEGGSALGGLNGTTKSFLLTGCPVGLVKQGCLENGKFDADCCALPGTSSCAGGGDPVSGGQCGANGAVYTCCEVCPANTHRHGCTENGHTDGDCCAAPGTGGCYKGEAARGSQCASNGAVTTCCPESGVSAPQDDVFFCWMVSFSTGPEAELTREQFNHDIGIFACAKYTVFSDGPMHPVPTTDMGSLKAPMGFWGSWANTAVFVRAWDKVLDDAQWESCGWTIKVDPDAVWYPQRLVAKFQHEDSFWPLYVRTIDQMMLGPLEILSHGAMRYFAANRHAKCYQNPTFTGEDGWITWCLDLLGVQMRHGDDLLVSSHDVGMCYNGQAVAFHPFKTLKPWAECYLASARQR